MSKPTLVVLAAGMASRYGSLKQVDGFGPNGETIIDYSIYDAIRAGFGKVVFVIREEFEQVMRQNFSKLDGKIDVAYAFQSFDLSKFGIDRQIERSKPWGTAHAVMSAEEQVGDSNFCVINADDFYGRDAFQKMADFLNKDVSDTNMSLMGFQVGNTMSDHGYVSRGVCEVTPEGNMASVTERTNIYYVSSDMENRKIVFEENGVEQELPFDTRVSMNFWGFTPKIFSIAREMFPDFVENNADNPKSEFYIPSIPDHMVKSGIADFKVIPTSSKWFGVTYKEDKPVVKESISKLVADGVYPEKLF